MATLTIDGRSLAAAKGASVLDVARAAGIPIPTLCHHEALEPWGGCRLCLVEVTKETWNGRRTIVAACTCPAEDGLIVLTRSDRVLEARRVTLDLLLARCPDTPVVRTLAAEYGIEHTSFRPTPNPTDCVLCGLCTRVCEHLGISAIASVNRGSGREIAPPFHEAPPDCVGCMACVEICPTRCIPGEKREPAWSVWGRTFEMVRCHTCGRAHVTLAHATWLAARLGVPVTEFDNCETCRRRELVQKVATLRCAS